MVLALIYFTYYFDADPLQVLIVALAAVASAAPTPADATEKRSDNPNCLGGSFLSCYNTLSALCLLQCSSEAGQPGGLPCINDCLHNAGDFCGNVCA